MTRSSMGYERQVFERSLALLRGQEHTPLLTVLNTQYYTKRQKCAGPQSTPVLTLLFPIYANFVSPHRLVRV
jgi:hypothetical protein